MDELEALQLAAMIEDSGYMFYLEAAKHVQNDEVRKLLNHLADAEKEHKAVFNGLYQEHLANKGDYDDEYLFNEDVEIYFRQLASSAVFPDAAAVPKLVKDLKSTDQVLEMAIESEEISIKYYRKLAQETRSEKTRDVANRLIKEEIDHKRELEQMLC